MRILLRQIIITKLTTLYFIGDGDFEALEPAGLDFGEGEILIVEAFPVEHLEGAEETGAEVVPVTPFVQGASGGD